MSLADIIAPDLAGAGGSGGAAPGYVDVFARFVRRIAPHLDKEVIDQITNVLTLMKDGKPCPASQVAVGSFAIGAMAVSMMHDVLAGNPVPAAPKLIIHSFRTHATRIVDVSAEPS